MWDNHCVYIFNTSRIQYEDNRDDKRDGFEILQKVDLNNISNEERDELKRLSKGNLQPFSQVVNEFRSRRNGNQSRNNSSAGTPTAIQADGVDIGTGGDSRTDEGEILEQALKMSKKR